jgi:hypothetical protein
MGWYREFRGESSFLNSTKSPENGRRKNGVIVAQSPLCPSVRSENGLTPMPFGKGHTLEGKADRSTALTVLASIQAAVSHVSIMDKDGYVEAARLYRP